MIGSYRNPSYIELSDGPVTIRLSKDAIVAVVEIDSNKENALFEFGPNQSMWKPIKLLTHFEKLN